MRIHDEIHYPVEPSEVSAMLADPAFSEQVSQRMGAVSASVEVDGDPAGPFTVTTVRTMPTDDFPDAARKLVGDTVDVRQVDAWRAPEPDGSRAGTIVVEIVGKPLRLEGTLALTPDAHGTAEAVDGDLRCSLPLVGGKLEKAAEPAFRAAIRQQVKVGSAWFGGR